ncbi:solute carrier family 66 member 2-like [Sycon ciliatum]|uniref:solute carrier family 66 member 2-like n=1 Tax=Sycon ciliatum TaxID=27933 RepID=UPI0020AD5B9E|eukprot:scpid47018/ scgid12113/ PQ-loop repeat-containing protein 1
MVGTIGLFKANSSRVHSILNKLGIPVDSSSSGIMSSSILASAISYGASAFMIVGGVLPYVPQYMTISKSGSVGGFSTKVCLVLLLANMLRIAFWFGHPFELPLLLQSIIMVIAMLVLLRLCVKVTPNTKGKRRFLDFDFDYFWKWTSFEDYVQFLAAMACAIGISMAALRHSYIFVEGIGLAALMTEACLALPQFLHNYETKSTQGMSVAMVTLWLAGDIFKTIYFIAKQTPLQFWLCGFLQISLDLAIFYQVGTYV